MSSQTEPLKETCLAEENPEAFHDFPQTTPVGRLDEVRAAREVNVCAPCR